jgi:hypothetical protein
MLQKHAEYKDTHVQIYSNIDDVNTTNSNLYIIQVHGKTILRTIQDLFLIELYQHENTWGRGSIH